MAVQDPGHRGHELVESGHRHEILLQYVSRLLPRSRLEFPNVVAGLVVAPFDPLAAKHPWVDDVLAHPLTARPFRNDREYVSIQVVVRVLRDESFFHRYRFLGLDVGRNSYGVEGIRIDVGVVEDNRGIVSHVLLEKGRVSRERHDRALALNANVVRKRESGLDDDSQAAVTPDSAIEQIAVLVRACANDAAICEHQANCLDRAYERSLSDVPAVHIYAEQPADGKVRVLLHDPQRKTVRIDVVLNLSPGDARLDGDLLCLLRETDYLVHLPHVELQRAISGGLASHAEAAAAN